jgi:hypothetical protein
MISTPRGEGASLKTLGGEQAQGARKVTRRAKGKNPTLSEYLGSFAELLKSFSPTNASRSILFKAGEGTNLGGKEPLVRGVDSSLQEKRRSSLRLYRNSLSPGDGIIPKIPGRFDPSGWKRCRENFPLC